MYIKNHRYNSDYPLILKFFNHNTDLWMELKTPKLIYSFAVCHNYIIIVLENKKVYYTNLDWTNGDIKREVQWKYINSLGDKYFLNGKIINFFNLK